MVNYIIEQFKTSKIFKYTVLLFALFTVWWLSIYIRGMVEGVENDYFTISYCVFALIGGITGWSYAKKWGGWKSTLGKAITLLTLGLLCQFLGQISYNFYIYGLGIEIPYPSIGDIIFLGSVFFYIYGSYVLTKVAGVSFGINTLSSKIIAFLIPLGILIISYVVFFNGYHPDWYNLVIVFLDLGYPIGQAIFVSITILALLFSKDILGGMMKRPIFLLLFALLLQYIADFSFSYQVSRETWHVGGTNDFLYALSYFLMTIALLSIGNMFYKVQES